MSESSRFRASPPRKSSLAHSISSSGSPGSSPDLLPRYATPTKNSETPNTTPGSSPDPSNNFPRFVSPFKRGDSIDIGPPVTPIIASAIPRRLSVTFTGDKQRKPSVAEFHGDLKAEQTRKSRRKFWVKSLIFSTLFAIGLMSGIAIGHWGVPYVTQKWPSTISGSCSDDESIALAATNNKAKSTATPLKPATVALDAVSYWQPTAGTTFQIQLSKVMTSTTNLPAAIQVYDVDLFDTPASVIAGLKAAGKNVICYFSAGTAENWRTDYSKFQAADLGNEMDDWDGEEWVHTPNANVRTIMVARLQLAKDKGCDGVDPDNVDVYGFGADSGFTDLTKATAIDYLTFLASKAHSLGLAIGLKNAGEIIPDVQPFLQWVVTEQCADYSECGIYTPFSTANKPVFNIQYPFVNNNRKTAVSSAVKAKYCTGNSNVPGFTNILKHMNLDSWVYTC
jgi:hypothetical protein